jgi:hypothetical protein
VCKYLLQEPQVLSIRPAIRHADTNASVKSAITDSIRHLLPKDSYANSSLCPALLDLDIHM